MASHQNKCGDFNRLLDDSEDSENENKKSKKGKDSDKESKAKELLEEEIWMIAAKRLYIDLQSFYKNCRARCNWENSQEVKCGDLRLHTQEQLDE